MLEAGLQNDDPDTRWHAFSAITSLNRRETFNHLIRGLRDAHYGIRHSAVFAVKSMAEEPDLRDPAILALKAMLRKERESWDNAIAAAWALSELGVAIDPRRFAEALKKDGLDHRLCAMALGKAKRLESVSLLLDGFERADTWNAWEFNKALESITGQDLGRHPGPWREWFDANRASLPEQWS